MVKKKQDVVGQHLTVHADGSLSWDWDALLQQVREATTLVAVTEVKVKQTRSKKKTKA